MQQQNRTSAVEPALLAGWLSARSVARGLPLPVMDHGGWRVDTGAPDEAVRYVFAGPTAQIRELAMAIRTPHTAIKMCGPPEQLQALAPCRWQLAPAGYFMTHTGGADADADAAPALPAGYRLEIDQAGAAVRVRIVDADGAQAASGYALEYGGVFIFDRISTEPGHRRRGLGAALMAALGSVQVARGARRVLVATEPGRALYASLGWHVLAPYSTLLSGPFTA